MRPRIQVLVLLPLAVGLAGCGGHFTDPSHFDDHVRIADCRFEVDHAYFYRDFMPVVGPSRGPDGGSPVGGVVELTLDNEGRDNRFSVTVTLYEDRDDDKFAIAAVAHDADAERRTGRTVLWDGLIDDDEVRHITVRLSDGPYLPVGTRVYAVLTWDAERGGNGSVRTPKIEIKGTY